VLTSSIGNATSAGLTLAAGNAPANGLITIEIDANELEAATGGALAGSLGVDSYIGVGFGAPAAADYATVLVILSGARYSNTASPTVTT